MVIVYHGHGHEILMDQGAHVATGSVVVWLWYLKKWVLKVEPLGWWGSWPHKRYTSGLPNGFERGFFWAKDAPLLFPLTVPLQQTIVLQ